MGTAKYRALIVDDDRTILKLSVMALEDEGFLCTTAADGVKAMERTTAEEFDLVIIDLAMPHRHGHSVAVELLSTPRRPAIVILTGVVEPRILKDLMARGVDDVIAKPVNFTMFAAKMKALVVRRQESSESLTTPGSICPDAAVSRVSISDLNQRLLGMSCILPLSCIAVDVYEMTNDRDGDTTRISAALERDPALLAEVLRIANSPRYNPNGDRVVEVELAVLMLGQKHVGELALANHALGAITGTVVPWVNAPLLSSRSIAAGIGLELLTARSDQSVHGLLAASIMYSLGRVVLGSLYPVQYGAVSEYCKKAGCTLSEAERLLFPETNTETLARLLQTWNVPKEIREPLSVIGHSYDQLASLTEISRGRAELLKVAVLVGELAVGQWDSWDVLEFPSESILQRLNIRDIGSYIADVRADLQSIELFRSSPAFDGGQPATQLQPPPRGSVVCRDLWPEAGTMIRPVLQSLGIACSEESQDLPLILNGIGADCETIKRQISIACKPPALTLVERRKAGSLGKDLTTISFPCSYAQLRTAIEKIAQVRCPNKPAVASSNELAVAST